MTDVINFPVRFKHQLPLDAIPEGRARHVVVFPDDGAWSVMETDEGGGSLFGGMSKAQAVNIALEAVLVYRATMEVRNAPLDDEPPELGCSA